jgi:hypothetical protein
VPGKLGNCERQHRGTIILSTIAKRAHQLFEERECKHRFELDDWLAAETELRRNEFDGSSSGSRFLVDCPRDPDVTTILSLTARSLVVFRSRTRHAGEANSGPDVQFSHLFSKEINPAQADVKAADGVLHVCQRRILQLRASFAPASGISVRFMSFQLAADRQCRATICVHTAGDFKEKGLL